MLLNVTQRLCMINNGVTPTCFTHRKTFHFHLQPSASDYKCTIIVAVPLRGWLGDTASEWVWSTLTELELVGLTPLILGKAILRQPFQLFVALQSLQISSERGMKCRQAVILMFLTADKTTQINFQMTSPDLQRSAGSWEECSSKRLPLLFLNCGVAGVFMCTVVSLTLSDYQRWVVQKVSHQLCSQLVEEATGDRPIENHILVLYHIHQRDRRRAWLLGHTLNLKNTQTHHKHPSECFICINLSWWYNIIVSFSILYLGQTHRSHQEHV